MKKTVIILFLFYCGNIFSQIDDFEYTEFNNNAISLEAFGHSRGVISLNYERIFNTINNNFFITARTGIGLDPGYDMEGEKFDRQTTIPIVLSTLFRRKNSFAQFSLSYSVTFISGLEDTISVPNQTFERFESTYSCSLGYRYMEEEGFIAQAYPVFQIINSESIKLNWSFGISVGYAF